MMYVYMATPVIKRDVVVIEKELNRFIKANKIPLKRVIKDDASNKVHWQKRELFELLESMRPGDELVVYEVSDLARSTLQIIELLDYLVDKEISVHFIKYNEFFKPDLSCDTEDFLNLMQCVENEFLTKRTIDAVERRRESGLPLGRPRGKRNSKRKLDKFKDEIVNYLCSGVSKSSVAKLIGCHPQTLYNYVDETGILEIVANKKNKKE